MKSPKKITTLVLRIISGILTAVLFAAVCFVLVMAHPKPDKEKRGDPQPLLTASPALAVSSRADMEPLVRSFPVPVMTFLDTAGLTFDCASSEDAALPGGAGRIASIWWKTEDGEEVILQSIYPSNAWSLLEGGYQPDTPAAVVRRASWPDEEAYTCTVATLAETCERHGITKTALLIVGEAAGRTGGGRSRLYDPAFSTGYRKGEENREG